MNLYIIVEGKKTEMNVYPAWIELLVPQLKRVGDAWDVSCNNYYLFSGGGIPRIYDHVLHAIVDINNINAEKKNNRGYDYLVVCMDTEEGDRETIENRINDDLKANNLVLAGTQLVICEQKVCMESWFLGNRFIFKSNPQSPEYLKCIQFYDVSKDDPELMGTGSPELNRAQYHHKYLKEMFRERHMVYSKSNTKEVEKEAYLKELIDRNQKTGHLSTFGNWLKFITSFR